MSPELIIAVSSAVLALASGLFSARASRKASVFAYELEQRKKKEDAAASAFEKAGKLKPRDAMEKLDAEFAKSQLE